MSEGELQTLFGDMTVVQLLLWIAAAIALIVLVVKAWPWLRKFMKTVDALSVLPEKLKLLDEIHHELHPNHGSSLRDSADRTERKVNELAETLATHMETADSDHERLSWLEQRFEEQK